MFAIHRPTYTNQNRGVMMNGVAKITLNNRESLIKTEEKPLLIDKKGEKGDRGPTGPSGNPGPKVLSWTKEIDLPSDEVTQLFVFPHENVEYNLSLLEIVVEGKGMVTFYLVEKQTGERLATISGNLTENFTVISHEDFAAPASTPAILSLEGITGDQDKPIKFISLTVTLMKR